MQYRKLRRLAACAMVAALYTAMALSLPMAAFGVVQFRYAEALTLLPVFSPWAGVGVTAGCLLTNAIGFAMGLTFPQDILFGTLATLVGCLFTWLLRGVRFRGIPVLSALSPVVWNTLIIGWEINAFFLPEGPSWLGFLSSALGVGLGEAAACCVLGLLIVALLERAGLDRLFREL